MANDKDRPGTLQLSPAGKRRREAILLEAQRALRGRRRRRIAAWTLAALVPVALGAGFTVMGFGFALPRTSTDEDAVALEDGDTAAARSAVDVEWVRPDPHVLSRYAVAGPPLPENVAVGDDELLALLEEAGHAAGIIRVEGRVIITGAGS